MSGFILRYLTDTSIKPRPGDIAAFYDAKLKGKKGLHTYSQHVGSVEEPLVGVISEFEDRKHKLRVLQVERGVPDEVSYRCEDLKGGKVVVRGTCKVRQCRVWKLTAWHDRFSVLGCERGRKCLYKYIADGICTRLFCTTKSS